MTWLLEQPSIGLLPETDVVPRFINRTQFTDGFEFDDRLVAALLDFPSHLLVVHRDADGPALNASAREIRAAIRRAEDRMVNLPASIPVVPVREMEAWLLIDEPAIRQAVRNPRGTAQLDLPRLHEVEACQDPKAVLRDALRAASGLSRRRWRQVDRIRPRAVADLIGDFAPLRQLPAFQAFEADLRKMIAEQGWPERLG